MIRSSRRRKERRKYRIHLLQTLFDDAIKKIDQTFFLRLNQSALHLEDKGKNLTPYPLFNNLHLEKEFYKKYPTIYHLRYALCNGDKEAFSDIRNVYLAIHHIIKYRGNFLSEGDIDTQKLDRSIVNNLNEEFSLISAENSDDGVVPSEKFLDPAAFDDVINILENKNFNKNEKKKRLAEIFTISKELKEYKNLFISLIVGGSFSLNKIYVEPDVKEISFAKSFEDNEEKFASIMQEDFAIVTIAKSIYDFISLKEILNGESSLSSAYIKIFDEHKKDLKQLKKILKEIDDAQGLKGVESLYYKVFKNKDIEYNYSSYVNVNTLKPKRSNIMDFNNFLKTTLEAKREFVSDKVLFDSILERCENRTFLNLISHCSTSLIPHQLHENELIKILNNCKYFYPEIYSHSNKILKLFRFRVPFYYGPFDDRSKGSNVVRKSLNKINPWNIEEIIDDEASKLKFMQSLTNHCTYLKMESVTPKDSILYQDFINLNRLNSLSINGEKISQSLKLDIFINLICKNQKTTLHKIAKFIKDYYSSHFGNIISISGINENDNFINSSRYAFQKVFNIQPKFLNQSSSEKYTSLDLFGKDINVVEDIIFILSIYTDSYQEGIKVIKKRYPNLNKEQIKACELFQPKGWGQLSRKLLNGIRYDLDGEKKDTIFELLLSTTENFQQITNNKIYNFAAIVDDCNKEFSIGKNKKQIVSEIIENQPSLMRRSIIQSLKIVDEIVKVSKRVPSSIVIEVTRKNNKPDAKKETISRKKELEEFLKGMIKDGTYKDQAEVCLEELNTCDPLSLRGKHLYLYFKQMGFDLYTGKKMTINDVMKGKYDIDHIIPQRLIKDDSLDNIVLVNSDLNEKEKGGQYPIPADIRKDNRALWDFLYRKEAISKTKYNNLIRSTEIQDNELEEFIHRQINVINSSNKALRDCLMVLYPNTRLIFSKSQYPSAVRKKYNIAKLRELNDTHHAFDAYLNIVSGSILFNRFGDMKVTAMRNRSNDEIDNDKNSFNMENYLFWYLDKANIELKEQLINYSKRHDFLLSYRPIYVDTDFYNATLYKKGSSDALIPLHTNGLLKDTKKYGGFLSLTTAYFISAYKKKNKGGVRVLVPIPLLYDKLSKTTEELEKQICEIHPDYFNFDWKHRLLSGQTIIYNGVPMIISPKNYKQVRLKPILPIFLSNVDISYITKGLKLVPNENLDDELIIYTDKEKKEKLTFSKQKNQEVYKKLVEKTELKIYSFIPMIAKFTVRNPYSNFEPLSIKEQLFYLLDMILLFTRHDPSPKIQTNLFHKSCEDFFNNAEITILDNSVTGLYQLKTKF